MSCFGGLMEEYQYLSIDRFDGQNLFSSAFFLSHFHADHIVGLSEDKFLKLLKSGKDVYLYTSEVTKSLLLADARFVELEKYIVPLPIEEPTVINIPVTRNGQSFPIVVTLLSAGHCPGSVMFLYEGNEGNVLYTGDFRLPNGSAERIRPLHTLGKRRKPIKSIYVDTTFCSANAISIPKREDCVASLIHLVRQWLGKNEKNCVRLNLSAKYGYEFLFLALNKAFNCKIYCCRKYLYQSLPPVYHILTDKPEFAKIFAGFKTDKFESEVKDLNFIKIILSTLYFTGNALPDQIYERISEDTYRFCFSFHSSYSEVCDFVKYVNPDNVYANVIPFCKTPLETVAKNLVSKCGLKPRKPSNFSAGVTDACSTNDLRTIDNSHSKPHFSHEMKRALSFKVDDEDTQDYCDRILGKVRKREREKAITDQCDNVVQEPLHLNSETLCAPNKFTVPCSPNCKAPTESKIDQLHVKLAMTGDSPSET